jgi:hypothetical protein
MDRRSPLTSLALLAAALVAAGPGIARGDEDRAFLEAFTDEPAEAPAAGDADAEPGVAELQRAAIRHAELEPDRVRSWQRRLRLAALAPQLRVQVGHGLGDLVGTTDSAGTTRLTVNNTGSWSFLVGATWSLDRLVFSPEELRLGREAQRVASRRERLVTDVSRLYYERRRLQAALARVPAPEEAAELRLQVDELTAVLDGITGGALGRRGIEEERGSARAR